LDKDKFADTLRRAEQLCRDREVRLTEQRRTVLELVCATARPISAYKILNLLRTKTGNPAPTTVYRALEFLVDQGLVHKLASLHAFVGCTHPERPHSGQFLICVDCGEVNELEDDSIVRSLRSAEKVTGFKTTYPVVELIGTCAQCTAKLSIEG
jgi:Fur family zinc uptake transcriptional regulator